MQELKDPMDEDALERLTLHQKSWHITQKSKDTSAQLKTMTAP